MTAEAPHSSLTDSHTGTAVVDPGCYGGGGPLSADAFLSLGSMEGIYTQIVARSETVAAAKATRALLWPGYLAAGVVALLASLIHYLPIAPFAVASGVGVRHPVSAAIIAILVGLIVRNTFTLPESINAGCKRTVRKVIPLAIVCMGAGLNFTHLISVGLTALLITVVCIAVAIAAGYYAAKLFGLSTKTSLLLGAGTGICGNSAIVAVAPLIDAKDDDVVLSVGTVNLFGLLAMFTWPIVGSQLALSSDQFGVWSGTSIHAVPQVVAAGFAHSADAGTMATLVKLVRVVFLAPIVFVFAVIYAKRHRRTESHESDRLAVRYFRLVPWFVTGFVIFALLNTFGLIPSLNFELTGYLTGTPRLVSVSVSETLTTIGKLLLMLAMAAIGLEVNVRQLTAVGGRVIAAGLVSTVVLGATSLTLIAILM